MYSELTRPIHDAPSEYQVPDPKWFVRTTSGSVIAELIDGVMRGETFLALIGPPGSGKTTAAAAIRDELVSRSVRVLSVCRGNRDSLRLRDIAAQLLGKPENAFNQDDIEQLFNIMTAREADESRLVLMVDDAETLQAAALEYLRLMSSMATVVVPQFVFVGRPEFWDSADRTTPFKLKELITARWELGRLSSDMTRVFIKRLLLSAGPSIQHVFDDGGLDALIERSDGLFGRVVSLLSVARAIRAERHVPWLTSSIIAEAAAKLDDEGTALFAHDDPSPYTAAESATFEEPECAPEALLVPVALPVLDLDSAWTIQPAVANPAPAWRRYAYAGGLVMAVFAAVAVTYWHASADAPRTGRLLSHVSEPASIAAPAQSEANAAAAAASSQEQAAPKPTGVKTAVADHPALSRPVDAAVAPAPAAPPAKAEEVRAAVADQSALSRPVDAAVAPAPAAPPAKAEGDQPTTNRPDGGGAVAAQAGVAVGDTAAGQSVQHDPAPDSGAAAVATPIDPQTPQAVMPLAPPLPTEPAQGGVTATPAAVHVTPGQADAAAPPSLGTTAGGAGDRQVAVAPSPPPVASTAAAGIVPAEFGGDKPTLAASVPAPIATNGLPVLLSRGDAMLALGDIAAARLLYERAAVLGSARAATAAGKTYDPSFLASIQASGILPDRAAAMAWYRKGGALGDPEGRRLADQAAAQRGN